MQVTQLGSVLVAFAKALEASGARGSAQPLLALVRAFAAAGSLTTQKFVTAIGKAEMAPTSDRAPKLGSVEAAIGGLVAVLEEGGAKKPLVADIELLLDLIRRHREVSIAEFESSVGRSVESASRRRPDNRGATPVDTKQLVESYLQRLEAALGNDNVFPGLYRELEADARITKTEAIEIASRFFEPMAASATRRKAMQKVLRRHKKLMDSRAASATIGGRAA